MTTQDATVIIIILATLLFFFQILLTIATVILDQRNKEIEELTKKKEPAPKREGKQTRDAHGRYTRRGPKQ